MAATAVTITAGSFSNLFPTPTVHASDVLPSKDENSDENTSFMSGEWLKTTQQDPILPSLAAFLMPFLVLRARKFALLFTLGSLFTIGSFSMLWGPVNHLKHLFSSERLTFTLTYFLSLFVTLYAALIVRSTVMTLTFGIIQIIALTWYVSSYVPGGLTALKLMSKICSSCMTKSVKSTISV
ncbi:Protein transport protein SFT2 [Trichoplax sp. H2]|nr:Protein transport protein SFT2 [Trichoplax sp. H2]|eukprot:RDD44047.1 Protein transport protein SFT2 [Trichoplax sp. H2]